VIHPDTELRLVNPEIGLGVFATALIPRGTLTWALDDLDQRISTRRLHTLSTECQALIDRYAYINGHGERILCWDIGRFMNHACDANSISTGFDVDVAVRDIRPGEQITNDYTLLNLDSAFQCSCGAPNCRANVGSDPEAWDALIPTHDDAVRSAFAAAGQVDQPLWPFVAQKAAVTRAFRDQATCPSIATHRYDSTVTKPVPRVRALRAR